MDPRSLRTQACRLASVVALFAPGVGQAETLEGRWGGDQASLALRPDGGRLETGCGALTIRGGVQPDRSGQFVATAALETYRPGPQRADEPVAAADVRVTGQVSGDVMTLRVQEAGGQPSHVYVLHRGAGARIVRCL